MTPAEHQRFERLEAQLAELGRRLGRLEVDNDDLRKFAGGVLNASDDARRANFLGLQDTAFPNGRVPLKTWAVYMGVSVRTIGDDLRDPERRGLHPEFWWLEGKKTGTRKRGSGFTTVDAIAAFQDAQRPEIRTFTCSANVADAVAQCMEGFES